MPSPMTAETEQFRKDLKKIMPGYGWTVHRPQFMESCLVATGTQSSGSNRTSTVQVTLDSGTYTVKSSGYGTKSPWRGTAAAPTLAQAFRQLQTHYERLAQTYRAMAAALQGARTA